MDTGTDCLLVAVWGSASNDVYASGCAGTIMHYDGKSWERLVWSSYIPGLWGTSSSDVFAVGNGVLHYDGNSGTVFDTPRYGHLESVWGSSLEDIYVVGWYGQIMHYDGTVWEMMPSGFSGSLYDVRGAAGDVIVVGTAGAILRGRR